MTTTANIIPLYVNIPMPHGLWTYTPTLLCANDSLILVDTGMPGMIQEILSQMEAVGFPIGKLTGVFITHQDIDHIGGISEVLNEKSDTEVYAHIADKPYIEGKLPLIKVLPKMLEPFGEKFSPPGEIVTQTVADGDKLDFAGGIIVIHTPGHTPGHVSLYHPATKTLIAGDAMLIRGEQLQGPNPIQTPDLEEAYRSLAKLTAYDIQRIICYHGGVYESDVNQRIAEIAAAGPPA
ncbi:MBL fold metallo-hydrolase [Paenibacillus sp. UNC451MF]|uniref:MBL fold metallo-hydrolase n=1 Tax=Paenibacillus sp. UNC451MF TaxID=1449063 RepID=UPI0004912873|nr:MBL fold metallo-hydrolase [Paenibacillus sp. UNC451MF]